jgi:hypothetical protein
MTTKRYVFVEGTTWPHPDDPESVEWALRYGGTPTISDRLTAASYIGAYRALVDMTQRDRNHRIATLRSARSVEDGTDG